MLKGKKAVSPLIATVLLIAFAVALGAVVMNWGKDYVETTAHDTSEKSNLDLSCQTDIDLEIKEIGGVPKVCYNSSHITVILENNGRINIVGLRFVFFDTSDSINISDQEENTSIIAGGVIKLDVAHGLSNTIAQVEVVPKIKPTGATKSQLCSKNALVIDDLVSCS